MIYIRNIFTQDLRDGKQIAFPKEPSNHFFNFDYNKPDPERNISFTFRDNNIQSRYYSLNGTVINTRLYPAGSEARIDGQLKAFLRDKLNSEVDDIIVFRFRNTDSFDFEFISKESENYMFFKSILGSRNHELSAEDDTEQEINNETTFREEEILKSFAKWLNKKPQNNYFENDYAKTVEYLNKLKTNYSDSFDYNVFEVEFKNLDDFIKLINENIWNKDSQFWTYSERDSNHRPRAILNNSNYQSFLKELIQSNYDKILDGYNKIYFGAPGTGKSYAVAQVTKNVPEDRKARVIFHPDYDYASFVGGYKPVTENSTVKYRFQPQVFTDIYVKAHQNPHQDYYLIIEEINRGNCAEIFGDIFQLLDRNPEYKVTPSEDLKQYLEEKIGSGNNGFEEGKMTMPENLTILATMNTSDQSLYPMDSAFKRRWQWEYVPIRYADSSDDDSCKSFAYRIQVTDGFEIRWSDFMKEINAHILDNQSLGMDKCLGNFFIQPKSGNNILFDDFVNKVIFYLWNDVFKEEENRIFGKEGYSALFPVETAGKAFFRKLAEEELKLENVAAKEEEEEEEAGGSENLQTGYGQPTELFNVAEPQNPDTEA